MALVLSTLFSLVRVRGGVALVASVALAGCAAGPNFKPPAAPRARTYLAKPPAEAAAVANFVAGTGQHFARGGKVASDWWTRLHSPALDALVRRALAHNPDLAARKAALRAAHEAVLAERGGLFPSVSAGVAASREQDPSAALAPVPANNAYLYSLFTPSVMIGYTPDLFGLGRRSRESLAAQAQAVRFQMLAARNTLTTNVVVTAVQEAALAAQVRGTRRLVALEQRGLVILKLKLAHGDASKLDVAAQRSVLAATQAALPDLNKQLAAAGHALAALVGDYPDQGSASSLDLAKLQLPASLPVSLPSQLVRQRPDVCIARADLHAASAAVGIAAAERLPHIELSADVGSTALAISRVFDSGTGFWGLAASLTAPIFAGGRLKHQELAAKAAYVEATDVYRSTVLHAFENVADVLVAIREDAKALQAATETMHAAATSLHLAQLKLHYGAIDTPQLLEAERAWQQAKVGLTAAQAERFTDTAALYQALGGGWWQQKDFGKQ